MIQPLRRIHAQAFQWLAIALPILLISGFASRQSLPNPPAHRFLFSATTPLATQTIQVDGSPLQLSMFQSRQEIAFHVSPETALNAPDVLVYAAGAEPRDTVSDDAVLLGEFVPGKLYRLQRRQSGFVVLYSLGHQQVLAESFSVEADLRWKNNNLSVREDKAQQSDDFRNDSSHRGPRAGQRG